MVVALRMRRDDEGRAVKTARKRWGFVLCGCGGEGGRYKFSSFLGSGRTGQCRYREAVQCDAMRCGAT